MYWDFGNGQIGDMGSHTFDLAWNVVDGGSPIGAEAEGDAFNPEVSPVGLTMHLDQPANSWRPAIRVSWFQGGHMPKSPKPYINLEQIDHGAMFKGDKGFLIADFTSRVLLPYGDTADLSYFKAQSLPGISTPNENTRQSFGNFQKEWTMACKGNLKTTCNFDYAGTAIENLLLGMTAYRAGKKLVFDPVAGRITNAPEANALLRREYRKGWTLKG